jgi:glutamyl-tRNA reductase
MRHLARVASSLDSLVVGEPQILGQLKAGFELGRGVRTVGPHLHRAFARAVRCAKLVRSRTSIGAGQVSVPSIAVELAREIFGDLKAHRAALIGAGEMGQTVARLLRDAGAGLTVVGRSAERVELLAAEFGAESRSLSELGEVLTAADVVVSSTSAPHAVVTRAEVERVLRRRRGRNLFIIDLAVPRDVESSVGELDGVFLYNVDDLSSVAEQGSVERRREAERAEQLVAQVVLEWRRWADAQQATPTIKALRAHLRSAFEAELGRSLRGRLRELDERQREALATLLEAGINRVLHAPTVRLREEAARDGGEALDELAGTLRELFELDRLPESELDRSSIRPLSVESGLGEAEREPRDGSARAASPEIRVEGASAEEPRE